MLRVSIRLASRVARVPRPMLTAACEANEKDHKSGTPTLKEEVKADETSKPIERDVISIFMDGFGF